MSSFSSTGRFGRWAPVAAVWALVACDGASTPSPNRLDAAVAPPTWPSDGLLTDTALQAVVERQNAGVTTGLMNTLYNGAATERFRAALALASIREGFGFQAVLDQIAHPDPRVRAATAFALAQMPRDDVTPALGQALETEADSMVRRHLVEALGFAGRPEAVEGLINRRTDVPEVTLVLAVARIALRADSVVPAAVEHLTRALRSKDGESREMATWYFGRQDDVAAWSDRVSDVRDALDAMALDDPAAAGLLRAVAKLADVTDVDRMVRFTRSPDWRMRVRAVSALGAVAADRTARETLFQALDDPSTHVTVTAAGSLAGLRRLLGEDMERMERWISDHPDDWRTGAPLLGGLAAQGRAGFVRDWLEARNDGDLAIRARGIGAMARARDQGVTRSLMELAESDTVALATAALQGLVSRWPNDRDNVELRQAYWDVFEQGLVRGDRGVVAGVSQVMADSVFVEMGSIELLGATYEALTPIEDVEAALAVVDALFASGRLEAIAPLRVAMDDAHLVVRERARDHIQSLARRRALAPTHATPVGREPDWAALGTLGKKPRLVLETEKGRVVVLMATELAPVTVQTVAEFAAAGRYDGVPFHRVVPDFVVQGGDFERGDGFGGPGFVIRTEITGIPFRRGVVGMASAGPDSEGSQFYITHSAQPQLDRQYTAFGWVTEGMDVVDRLYERDRIVRASVEADPVASSSPAGAGG